MVTLRPPYSLLLAQLLSRCQAGLGMRLKCRICPRRTYRSQLAAVTVTRMAYDLSRRDLSRLLKMNFLLAVPLYKLILFVTMNCDRILLQFAL